MLDFLLDILVEFLFHSLWRLIQAVFGGIGWCFKSLYCWIFLRNRGSGARALP